ncbi:MAG: hypothetical protein E6J14_11450 [Chloroflexi bacterium]|nr:MAG: hypothetical protein E6J14_11450 [Chloroflexota bacterium]
MIVVAVIGLAAVVVLVVGFVVGVWRMSAREPNRGWELDESLYPQVGEAIPKQPPPKSHQPRH